MTLRYFISSAIFFFLIFVPATAFSSTAVITAPAKFKSRSRIKFAKIISSTSKYSIRKARDKGVSLAAAAKRSAPWAATGGNGRLVPRWISARSYLVVDNRTGAVIFARSPDRKAQPASTIKVITALIAINYLDDKDLVYPSRRAAAMPRSKVYLRPGAAYRAGELIDAVLLDSANDASVALAEKIAGSERLFARMMTYKASIWGAGNTFCRTATGLTARGQYTTVRDLVTVFNRAMENPEFARRVARVRERTSFGRTLRNHNRALWRIHGAEGGKTGFTNAARQTYVGTFSRHGNEITLAIMGSEAMWNDIERLVNAAFARLPSRGYGGRLLVAARYKDTGPMRLSALGWGRLSPVPRM